MDNTKCPPFAVMETSAIMLYLLKKYDSKDAFGFKDELERNQCLQWLFFWHGSVSSPRFSVPSLEYMMWVRMLMTAQGQPIEGQLNYFGKLADRKDECKILPLA